MKKIFVFILLGVLANTAISYADIPSPWIRQYGYTNKATDKFLFGAKNTLLGWTELVSQPLHHHRTNKDLVTHLGKGVKNAVYDTVGGAATLVTFPVTGLDIHLPESGVKI